MPWLLAFRAWFSELRRDRLVVGAALCLLVPALIHLGTLESSETATVEQLVSPARAEETRRLRALFGGESDLSLLSVAVDRGTLRDERIAALETAISSSPGVAHVWSPLSRPRLALERSARRAAAANHEEPGPRVVLARGPPPGGPAAPLDRLLRPDRRTACFLVLLGPEAAALSGARRALSSLSERLNARLAPGETARFAGFPAQRVASWEQARRDAPRVLPWLAVAALTVPLLFFRSIWAALFPLLVAGLATTATLLAYRAVHGGIEPWALVLVPVVWAVATMDTTHLYECVAKRRARGDPDPVGAAARELAAPCAATALVTAVSLLTLAAPGGPPLLSTFGIWGAVGTCVAYALSFVVGPPLLRLAQGRAAAPAGPPRAARRLVALCQRRAGLVLLVWVALLALGASALPRLATASSYEAPFVEDHPFSRDLAGLRAATGSDLVPIEIYLEPGEKRQGDARGLLAASIALHEYVVKLPETRVALSAAALASELLQHDPLAPALKRRLRHGRTLGDTLDELAQDPRLRPWIDPKVHTTRTVLLLTPATLERRAELRAWIEHFVATVLDGYEIHFGGVGFLYEAAEADGRTAVAWGMLGDLGLLLLALMLVLRRARVVVAGLVGNVAPLVLLAAAMVLAGVPWSLGLLGLPIIVLGLSADDTLHLLWKTRHRELPLPTALSLAYRRYGSAALATSLLVAACLASLSASGFAASRQLGWLLPTGIVLALAAELTLVPALLRLLRRRVRARRRR